MNDLSDTCDPFYFVPAVGRIASLFRRRNWLESPLGEPTGWPVHLRTALGLALHAEEPAILYWGDACYCFYNDAALSAPVLAGQLPDVGEEGGKGWPGSWEEERKRLDEVRHKAGPLLAGGWIYRPVFGDQGRAEGVYVSVAPAKDLMPADPQEESEYTFRQIIAQAPVAMCIVTGSKYVVKVANAWMSRLWDKSLDQVINRPLFEAVPDARAQGLEEILEGVYTSGVPFHASERPVVLWRQGRPETLYLNFVCEPYNKEHTGGEPGVFTVAVDVTEQVLARRKIEEAEEKARLAIHSAELGVYGVTYANDHMETDSRFNAIWGLSRPVARQEYAALLHPDDRETRQAAHEASLKSGHLDYQARLIWKDQSVRWVRVTGKVLYDVNGVPEKLIGIVQDITPQVIARQKTEEEVTERTKELAEAIRNLQKSNAELAQFAYIASHDLQEPLRKISTFTQMLENRLGEGLDEQSMGYLKKINSSSLRMKNLINDVLNYSELGKDGKSFTKVDLNKILEQVITDFELMIEQKDAQIELEPLPEVEAIPLQMQQLFSNLLGNSLKFARAGGVRPLIRISCAALSEQDGGNPRLNRSLSYFKIQVSDNGIGIKPEYREQIFNIFQRLHRKSEYEGTGIGLALCRKIAQNHQGDLNAAGSSEEGAVFNILLPYQQ